MDTRAIRLAAAVAVGCGLTGQEPPSPTFRYGAGDVYIYIDVECTLQRETRVPSALRWRAFVWRADAAAGS